LIPKDESYVSFTLRLDKSVYINKPEPDPAEHLIANLILRGTVIPPLMVEFPSTQRFDLEIINDSDDTVVYRWSDGRIFPQMASIGPLVGEVIWKVEVVLVDSSGKSMPEGNYIARAFLTTYHPPPQLQNRIPKYSATVGFMISNQIPPLDPFGQ
jgi:hypothetical protein